MPKSQASYITHGSRGLKFFPFHLLNSLLNLVVYIYLPNLILQCGVGMGSADAIASVVISVRLTSLRMKGPPPQWFDPGEVFFFEIFFPSVIYLRDSCTKDERFRALRAVYLVC